jgi:hypothetical protein
MDVARGWVDARFLELDFVGVRLLDALNPSFGVREAGVHVE